MYSQLKIVNYILRRIQTHNNAINEKDVIAKLEFE